MNPGQREMSQSAGQLSDWVVSACPDGLWVFDDDGGTTFANERMAEMLGVEHATVVGFSAYDAFDEGGRVDLRDHLEQLRHTREPGADLHCLLLRPDGSTFWALVSHTPLTDAEGAFRGWLHRVSEYTAERQRYEELEHREQLLAEAQAIARIGSWDWDLREDRLTWSDELFRVYGIDPATFEPSYDRFLERLHPDDRDQVAGAVAEAALTSRPFALDFRVNGDDGEPRWIRGCGRSWDDASGNVVRIVGTSQDISMTKETENAMAFLTVMGSAANEASTLQDVLVAADSLARPYAQWPAVLVSFPAEALPGEGGSSELLHLDVRWEASDEAQRLAARELAARVAEEQRTIEMPGPTGTVLIGGAVVSGGRLACVVVSDTRRTSLPSTADRNVFGQLLSLLAHVAERDWAAVELAAARDQALRASKAKSEFLATMSHEIRTPLNGVIGLSELLGSTDLTPHQRRLANGVDQAGRTLLALVNDVLDLSKIEAGRLDLEEVDFNLRSVIEESVGLVSERAREKQLELVVSGAGDLPTAVRGDQFRLGQVITNLVANAVKFTEKGEVVVRATGEQDADGVRVRIEVRDTGVGIDPEVEDRLFTAFSQADSSTTRQYGGTGLGLAISKRIVTAMDGEIGVDSEQGVGSTFWFTVSLTPALEDVHDPDSVRESAVAGLRVLVVDDNDTNRWILTEQLRSWSVGVRAVESANDALLELEAAARHGAAYDIVLLDYLMPGTDGAQLARIIRSERRFDCPRMVLLSSAMEPEAEFLEEAGIDTFLSKPVRSARLRKTLAVLGGRVEENHPPPVVARVPVEPGSRGRILVVEDNPLNQMVAEGVLQRLGYTVVMSENGAEGVEAFALQNDGKPFDAVLMDCQMPVMDGYDATLAIRDLNEAGARIPIIAMTAAVVAEERQRCVDVGMNDFLAKPVDVGLLERTLDHWIPGGASGAGAASAGPAAPPTTASPPETSAPPVMDHRRVAELLEGGAADPPMVLRMLDRFGSRAVSATVGMGEAVRAGDAAEVRQVSHGLRGSALNLGLVRLARLCEGIELAAGAGELPAPAVLAELEAEVAMGINELDAFAQTMTMAYDSAPSGG